LFGNRAVAEDIKSSLPYVQAGVVFGVFVVINFLLLLASMFNVYTLGSLFGDLAAFFSVVTVVLFAIVLFGAVLWFAFSFLVFGASKLGNGSDVSTGAAFCFTAFFYPIYTLFIAVIFLVSLVVLSGAFIAAWYLVSVIILLFVGTILLFVCLYRFFRVSYVLSLGKSSLAVGAYAIGLLVVYFLIRLLVGITTTSIVGGVVGV